MAKQKAATTPKKVKVAETGAVSKEQVDIALNKIFDSASKAINETRNKEIKVSLEQVDATLKAIFDSINRANIEGENITIPDFNKVLQS
jgi:nucleoid DNA-binding protein